MRYTLFSHLVTGGRGSASSPYGFTLALFSSSVPLTPLGECAGDDERRLSQKIYFFSQQTTKRSESPLID